MNYTENTIVQQTTAEYLEQELGWNIDQSPTFKCQMDLSINPSTRRSNLDNWTRSNLQLDGCEIFSEPT